MSWNEFKPWENKALPGGIGFDKSFEIHAGDILLSRSNTPKLVGASVYITTTPPRLLLSDKSLRLIPSALVDRRWLQLFISSPDVREQFSRAAGGTSGSMLNISQKDISSIILPLPPFVEQVRIANVANSRFAALESIAMQVREALVEIGQLRASLLSQATTGILESSSKQDKPVSLLLRAIKNQKHALQESKDHRPKRKGRIKMKSLNKKRSILEILDEFPEGIPPDRLLLAAGYNEDEIPAFYQNLRSIETSISELRPSRQTVLIKRRKT
jgi:type I restriction enzyme S subunit